MFTAQELNTLLLAVKHACQDGFYIDEALKEKLEKLVIKKAEFEKRLNELAVKKAIREAEFKEKFKAALEAPIPQGIVDVEKWDGAFMAALSNPKIRDMFFKSYLRPRIPAEVAFIDFCKKCRGMAKKYPEKYDELVKRGNVDPDLEKQLEKMWREDVIFRI